MMMSQQQSQPQFLGVQAPQLQPQPQDPQAVAGVQAPQPQPQDPQAVAVPVPTPVPKKPQGLNHLSADSFNALAHQRFAEGANGAANAFHAGVNGAANGWKRVDGAVGIASGANKVNEAAARQAKKLDEKEGIMKKLRQLVPRVNPLAKDAAPQLGAAAAPAPQAPGAAGQPPTPGASEAGVQALVLAAGDRVTYVSRSSNEPYPGQVVSISSHAIQVQLDGIVEKKTVGPEDFWRISDSSKFEGTRTSDAHHPKVVVFERGQSVQYKSRSSGETYSGKVVASLAAGGVQLELDGVENAKDVAAEDLWRIQ